MKNYLIALGLWSLAFLTGCGVKGDPVPYVDPITNPSDQRK